MTAAATKAPNYTPAQEAQILRMAQDAGGKLTKEHAEQLAEEWGKTVKSVVAKISRLEVYAAQKYTTKNGSTPIKKDQHADAIGAILRLSEGEIDSLTKSNKSALEKIFRALADSRPIDGNS